MYQSKQAGSVRHRLGRWAAKRGWRRARCLLMEPYRWWDWGHRLMIIVGMDVGGNWSAPEPPSWWYRRGPAKRMARTGYPRHPISTFQVVTDYDEFRRLTEGLNEDQRYEWNAINVNQDGALQLGHMYWGGQFYGLPPDERPLLRRYLRMWRRLDWFGARSWLYSQALHAAVHCKQPWTCQAVPPKDSAGYSHWYCTLPRRHDGMHRFQSYVWGEIGGEPIGTFYKPSETAEA